ncbi:MAG: electron transport complex protein RnfA [Bacteroidales bacterium]|jgi:electron transport complex protein RnfA|nr:electron transport complex protein RnfA [Bacteroidales bacterium]MBQ1636541.1 electron transport complex protein RnfA [Bacteroidales bacterium]MBQ1679578.1 electron transport complex protein RnfA [Bacteroidales bacterium]MBQ1831424.1 electron transport complex protein RnfA [Bacteroidales bacterium]MBQ2148961.1 electron transport complex protein RnfA [Bacteroidales bacterium]
MKILLIFISAIFVNNVVLSQFLGVCPFLGVSKKVNTAVGMTAAVTFVMAIATLVTFLLQKYVLVPFNLVFLQTVSFILVIASLVQMVEIIIKKISPSLYQALGIFLPLITTNCVVLGVAIQVVTNEYNFGFAEGARMLGLGESLIFAIATAIGYGLALILFAGIREQLELSNVPKGFKGVPIALLTAGIMALAFMGFSGLV